MADLLAILAHHVIGSVIGTLDRAVKSPPPDDHDVVILVSERMPSLDLPIPDDSTLRKAISDELGQPIDEKQIDAFLEMVWQHDTDSAKKSGNQI